MRIVNLALCMGLALGGCNGKTEPSGGPSGGGGASGAPNDPILLASNQNAPTLIAVDAQNVYWINNATFGGLYKMPKAGGAVSALYQGATQEIGSLVVDENAAYFAAGDSILAVPLAGGPARSVAAANTKTIGLAAGQLYWLEPSSDPSGANAVVKRVPVGGGSPTTLSLPAAPRVRMASMFATSDKDAVYLGSAEAIVRIPLDGTALTVIPSEMARAMAVDGENIYLTASESVDLLTTSSPTPAHVSSVTFPWGIAVDGAAAYVIGTYSRQVLRIAKGGGPAATLAQDSEQPQAVAIDEATVFWTNSSSIMKVAK